MENADREKYYLTPAGLRKHQAEYEKLKKSRAGKKQKMKELKDELWRPEDLNPDYETLRTELNFLERRLRELENILKNTKILKFSKQSPKRVTIGATVKIEIEGEIEEFTIVGTLETDPLKKRISTESPIGKAILGKAVGETIKCKTEIVNYSCKIIEIK